jgi:hypothetical protein
VADQIYWLHDAERFDELAATATNIFIALGHSDGVAQAVGHCISTAYQLANRAENALKAGDLFDELGRYRQAGDILQKAASLLGLPPGAAASQVKWWHQYAIRKNLQWLATC